jgi:type IV secretory pathway TrbD component
MESSAAVGADDVVCPTWMGCIALVLMLIAEFGFVLWIRGLSIKEYFATRDPVSGTAYYLLLIVFAIMPLLVAGK